MVEFSPALSTLIGALVGASAAIIGGILTGMRQARVEDKKISLEREKVNLSQMSILKSEMRDVVQKCIAKMASATHSMCWLTWLAEESPSRITEERVKLYDEEIHILFPEMLGLQVRISTYNSELGRRFSDILREIESLDAKIGAAALHLLDGDKSKIKELKLYHSETNKLFNEKLSQICNETSMEKFGFDKLIFNEN